jgi:hypothetical protein
MLETDASLVKAVVEEEGKGLWICIYCGNFETVDHLFFNWPISQLLWVWVGISLRWGQRPIYLTNYHDMMDVGEVDRSKSVNLSIVAIISDEARNGWRGGLLPSPSSSSPSFPPSSFSWQ